MVPDTPEKVSEMMDTPPIKSDIEQGAIHNGLNAGQLKEYTKASALFWGSH